MEDITITEHIIIPSEELDVSFARSGGPGGQNVNKVNTKVTLYWRVQDSQVLPPTVKNRFLAIAASKLCADGSFQVTSQEHREQSTNLRACQEKLRKLVLEALKPVKKRRPTKPSKASQKRRLNEKRLQADKKAGRNQGNWEQ